MISAGSAPACRFTCRLRAAVMELAVIRNDGLLTNFPELRVRASVGPMLALYTSSPSSLVSRRYPPLGNRQLLMPAWEVNPYWVMSPVNRWAASAELYRDERPAVLVAFGLVDFDELVAAQNGGVDVRPVGSRIIRVEGDLAASLDERLHLGGVLAGHFHDDVVGLSAGAGFDVFDFRAAEPGGVDLRADDGDDVVPCGLRDAAANRVRRVASVLKRGAQAAGGDVLVDFDAAGGRAGTDVPAVDVEGGADAGGDLAFVVR